MAAGELSIDIINNLEDVCEGFSLLERFGISTNFCQSLDDIKERLRLHYYKGKGQGPHFQTVQEVISSIRDTDLNKRHELDTILQEVNAKLGQLDSNIVQHLVGEETLKTSLHEDLERHSLDLRTGECPILVTGETSSGKSSLLNLLLGKEILPRRLLSCTSTICKIRYGSELKVRIQGEDGCWTENTWTSADDCAEHIAKCAAKEESRDHQEIATQNIEIFIPLDFLKTGVYIIDSPGFGEHPQIDNQLIDYISNNEIFAFIYVIKSDNAGGVQEDRLQRILKFIVEKQKASHLTNFNPNSAIFICNRWDLVPECEKDVVFNDNLLKLSRCWPDLRTDQVFCMSTVKAWNTLQAGYVTEDYNALLEGIHKLMPVSLQMKLNYNHKWIEHFLSRTLHHISSYLAKTRFSSQELQARQKAADMRLHKVERESEAIMKSLDKQLDKFNRKIALSLSEYLQTAEAQAKISCWQLQQLPHAKAEDVWTDIEAEIDTTVEKRLLNILRTWDERNKLFQDSQKELYYMFKKEFLIVESQLESIENMMQSDNWSLSDKNDEEMNNFVSLIDSVHMSDGIFSDFNLSTLQKIALGIVAPVLVPIAIGLLAGTPIVLSWDFKKWQKRSNAQRNLEKYMDDPVSFVHDRSMKVLQKVCDYDVVYEYVYNQMEPARCHLESMRSAIPKLVEANRQLLDSIMHDKRSKAEIEANYLHLEASIPKLQEQLAAFCNLHIRKYDYKRDDVELLPPDTVLGKPNRILGLWTEISKGRLTDGQDTARVSVKTFINNFNNLHLLMEENHFSKARHPHVAKLIGVFEAQKGIPGLLLEPNLVKARRELFGFKALPRSCQGRGALMERCKGILEQVGMGLEYLHYKGLVHMELTLDTIMLQANKDHVKLVNITEPRKADLPPETSTGLTGDFVYLSPEVLNGGIYHARADMYSLALIMIELWKQDRIFKEYRKLPLQEFITKQADGVVKIDNEDQINPFYELICGCLLEGSAVTTSTGFVNHIRKISVWKEQDRNEVE